MVLSINNTHEIAKTLEFAGIDSCEELIEVCTRTVLDELVYEDGDAQVPLKLASKVKLANVIEWWHSQEFELEEEVEQAWAEMTSRAFRIWCHELARQTHQQAQPSQVQVALELPSVPETMPITIPSPAPRIFTAKFYLSDYKPLTEPKFWSQWSYKTKVLADSHGIGDCFDTTINQDDVVLQDPEFKAKQRVAFSVLSDKVTFPEGQGIVREFEETRDALAAYRKLKLRFAKGSSARISASSIEKELILMELDDKWKQ